MEISRFFSPGTNNQACFSNLVRWSLKKYAIYAGDVINNSVEIYINKAPELQKTGCAVKFAEHINNVLYKFLIIHHNESEYKAFEDKCTHNGKELEYNHDKSQIKCVSRNSVFDANGNKIRGKALGPLKHYITSLENNILTISV